ncbi:MAG TPA: hypothetical protein VGH81_04125 [Rudaea sp.]|jgi:hypothetical protein
MIAALDEIRDELQRHRSPTAKINKRPSTAALFIASAIVLIAAP